MLTATEMARGRTSRRQLPSLKQQYHDYTLQRIEAYKNTLSRAELMALGNEAATELQSGAAGQFVLTEILMEETVDGLIRKRLRLPSYRRWRNQILALRQAQREPVHWGVDPASALVLLLPRLEMGDHTLVIGGGVRAEASLLAAHDAVVTFVDEDLAAVEQLEARMAEESLGTRVMAYVASLGEWLPPLPEAMALVVVDASTLAALPHPRRRALLAQAQAVTAAQGVHVLLPGDGHGAPEAYLSHYPEWEREPAKPGRKGKASRSHGVILTRPPEPTSVERATARG
jgi:hypothetical protein